MYCTSSVRYRARYQYDFMYRRCVTHRYLFLNRQNCMKNSAVSLRNFKVFLLSSLSFVLVKIRKSFVVPYIEVAVHFAIQRRLLEHFFLTTAFFYLCRSTWRTSTTTNQSSRKRLTPRRSANQSPSAPPYSQCAPRTKTRAKMGKSSTRSSPSRASRTCFALIRRRGWCLPGSPWTGRRRPVTVWSWRPQIR
jgi:hypothetical protein